MTQPDWNARYAAGDSPWDTGQPDAHLVELVSAGTLPPGRVLEVGCGTGTNAVWLAGRGFDVLGVDLSPLAIERAHARAAGVPRCRFELGDFLDGEPPEGPFDLVFDRGCFHVFDAVEARARFAERVARALAPGGHWLSLVGSTEGPARDTGPPRRSAREVLAAIEPVLSLMALRAVVFEANLPAPAQAWLCLSRRREVPAQPSTWRGGAPGPELLVLDGAIPGARGFSFAALASLPEQVPDVAAHVPGRAGGAVRLRAILAAAGAGEARFATLRSQDGFAVCVPLAGLAEALVVYRLGDGPLSEKQGGPVRLLVPDVERCGIEGVDACANVKALARIELTREPTAVRHSHR